MESTWIIGQRFSGFNNYCERFIVIKTYSFNRSILTYQKPKRSRDIAIRFGKFDRTIFGIN